MNEAPETEAAEAASGYILNLKINTAHLAAAMSLLYQHFLNTAYMQYFTYQVDRQNKPGQKIFPC